MERMEQGSVMRTAYSPFYLIITAFLVVITVSYLRHGLAVDYPVSDLFFNPVKNQWLWPKADKTLTFWLHDFIRLGFITFGLVCIAIIIASLYIPSLTAYRLSMVMIVIAMIVIPVMVSYLKNQTNRFCPDQLVQYQSYVTEGQKGHCYPASHPSIGFSLLILGATARKRHFKILGYGAATIIGIALTVIQLGRGEHFLSHSIATCIIAAWVTYFLSYIKTRIDHGKFTPHTL